MTMQDGRQLQPRYITNAAGERTDVILSMEEFAALLQDLEDLIAITARKEEESVAREEMLAELKRDGLVRE